MGILKTCGECGEPFLDESMFGLLRRCEQCSMIDKSLPFSWDEKRGQNDREGFGVGNR